MSTPLVRTSPPTADFYNNCIIPICKSFRIVSSTASGTIPMKLVAPLYKMVQWTFILLSRSQS